MYRKFTIILLLIYLISCEKSPVIKSKAELLQQNAWYLSETHIVSYDNNNNQVLKDTIVKSETCEINSTLRFINDTACSKYISCGFVTPTEKQGKWKLTNDSLLTVTISVQIQNGGSIFFANAGIDQAKLIEIINDHFIVKRIENWFSISAGSVVEYRNEISLTYKSK